MPESSNSAPQRPRHNGAVHRRASDGLPSGGRGPTPPLPLDHSSTNSGVGVGAIAGYDESWHHLTLNNAAAASANSAASALGVAIGSSAAAPSGVLSPDLASRNRPRSASNCSMDGDTHVWDSVWPTTQTRRTPSTYEPGQPGPSRLPMAPISPYHTPSFNPGVIQAQAQAAASRQHLVSTSPPSAAHPDLAAAAFTDRFSSSSYHSPPQSPPSSSAAAWGPQDPEPTSPVGSGLASGNPRTSRPIAYTADSPSPAKSAGSSNSSSGSSIASSPPISSITIPNPRPRLDRPPSFISSIAELAPPFISRSLTSPSSRLTRRLSETAIVRPNASLREAGQTGLSTTIQQGEPRRRGVEDMTTAEILLSPSMTLLRPAVPRRVKSAQDAHGARSHLGLDNNTIPLSSPPRLADVAISSLSQPPVDGAHFDDDSAVFEMDDHAIADDDEGDSDRDGSPTPPALPTTPIPPTSPWEDGAMPTPLDVPEPPSPLTLVDEGDLLPSNTPIVEMDVTFDDEGLNTLERIFLLSRSEYAFHRAYVARVLGDLLGDVDPCESVEYVLPLISAFSLDEDESVKEAFAADLHRILWYFFTTCQLLPAEEENGLHHPHYAAEGSPSVHQLPETISQLELEGMHHRTMPIDIGAPIPHAHPHPASSSSETTSESQEGSSSRESHHTEYGLFGSASEGVDTPVTSVTASSAGNGFDGSKPFEPMSDGFNNPGAEHMWTPDTAEMVQPPMLHVGFFRPLLGTMLLSLNPQVANPTRDGIIQLVARLRGHGPVTAETWGSTAAVAEERTTYLSQTGPHCHQTLPFDQEARDLIEQELLYGIVLGMGSLSTDVPDSLFNEGVEILGDDGEVIDQEYEAEMYRLQMIHEATLGRALSLSFIGAMSELYPPEDIVRYGFVDEVIRGQDGDVSTRAEAALVMGNVARAAPPEEIDRLLETFVNFSHDEDDKVRQSVCTVLPALCKRIQSDDERREFAILAMRGFMENPNEDVQCAALEALGEVIYSFANDPMGPPYELLEIYCNDKSSTPDDCDWDILASFNFPGVCLTLGAERWPELRGLYSRLVSRAGDRVLRTVAASLHELANILEPEQVAEDILPVYNRCLQCGDDIRERIFEHIDVLIARLPQALGWSCFRQLSQMWKDDTLGGWRAREQLALHIPSFLETFHQHTEVAAVLDMMQSALLDRFAAVRDAATFAVPRSYEILGRAKCSQNVLHRMLLNLGASETYRERLTFVRCLREFIRPPPNRRAFEEFFMPSLPKLSRDVVDVRLGLAKVIGDLFVIGAFYGDVALPVPLQIRNLAAVLAEDESLDVREIVTRIGADRWASQPALEALVQEIRESPSPGAIGVVIEHALDSTGTAESNLAEAIEGRHTRAAVASPLVPRHAPGLDLDMDLADPAVEDMDPFASSFAAAESESSASGSGTTLTRAGLDKNPPSLLFRTESGEKTTPSLLLRTESGERRV